MAKRQHKAYVLVKDAKTQKGKGVTVHGWTVFRLIQLLKKIDSGEVEIVDKAA